MWDGRSNWLRGRRLLDGCRSLRAVVELGGTLAPSRGDKVSVSVSMHSTLDRFGHGW